MVLSLSLSSIYRLCSIYPPPPLLNDPINSTFEMAGMYFPLLDDRYIFQTKPVELEMPPKRRLSEGSDGGEEEEAVGHIEEEEKVREAGEIMFVVLTVH